MTSPETQILKIDETGAQPLPDAPQGGTVLLLHTEGGREDGWAGRAALALARGWRDQDRRLFLCDASLEAPALHKAAGVTNGEGISDALRFGTSFKRVAHRLDANLFLATAGTVAVDAGALRESPRWDSFTAGFSEAGALLVLFAPADGASVDALVRRADLVYVLASPGETVSEDHLGAEPSLILLRSDGKHPEAVLNAEDSALATSLDWDASGDEEHVGAEVPDDDSVIDETETPDPDEDESDDPEVEQPEPVVASADTLSPWTPDDFDAEDEAPSSVEETPSGEDLADESEMVIDLSDGDDVFDLSAFAPTEDVSDASGDSTATPDDPADVPAWERPVPDDDVEVVVEAAAEFEDPLRFLDPLIGDAADPAPEMPAGFAGLPAESEADSTASEDGASAPSRIDTPVVAPKRESEKSSTGRTVLVLILLAVVVLVTAIWFGLIEIPGLSLADASESTSAAGLAALGATGADPATASSATPTPQAEIAAFGLALGSFSDVEVARAEARTWSDRVAGVQFVLAPVQVDGQVWYRLLAGPASDSETAQALAETLSAAADGVDPSNWLVREASLAFLLGETRGRSAAEQRVTVLQSLGIPAHILRVPYSDGSEVFRVYAGAYASASEAAFLEQLLQDQEITNAPLTERLGTLSE